MNVMTMGKMIVISDRVLSGITLNAKHMRGVEIRLPYAFKNRPVILANFYSVSHDEIPFTLGEITCGDKVNGRYVNDESIGKEVWICENPGVIMSVFNITYANWGDQTQITIGANNTNVGQPVDYRYFCDYIITGELL